MDSRFLWFYELFGLLVALWLYGFCSLITATRSLKIRHLRLKENLDIIFELKGGKVFLKVLNGECRCVLFDLATAKVII